MSINLTVGAGILINERLRFRLFLGEEIRADSLDERRTRQAI